jgi:hypothetical protein
MFADAMFIVLAAGEEGRKMRIKPQKALEKHTAPILVRSGVSGVRISQGRN